MRAKYAWSLVLTCRTQVQLESYLDGQKRMLKSKSQPEVCQVCSTNFDAHSMQYVIYKCDSRTCKEDGREQKCGWLLKVLSCEIEDCITIYQHGGHLSAAPPSPRPGELNLSMKRFIRERAQAGDRPAQAMYKMVDLFKVKDSDPPKLLSKVQFQVRSYKKTALHDNDFIEDMIDLAAAHRYQGDMNETSAFAFGFPSDDRNQPVLGAGTEESPLLVGFATKISVRRLAMAATYVLHLDATFKLNTKGYPVIVIGISDLWRQFHPICFFLVSDLKQPQWQTALHETLVLYELVSGLKAQIGLVMMDADNAQRTAFEIEALILTQADRQPCFLMCFFHVMTNVRKHTRPFAAENKKLVFKHVYRIHYSRSPAEKQVRINEAVQAWDINPEMRQFSIYFATQWLSGRFSNWQCFLTPTGHAKTNNPVENFNRQIKNSHSMRRLLRLNPLFLELLKVCSVRSLVVKRFQTSARAAPHILRDFRKLASKNLLYVGEPPEADEQPVQQQSEGVQQQSGDARFPIDFLVGQIGWNTIEAHSTAAAPSDIVQPHHGCTSEGDELFICQRSDLDDRSTVPLNSNANADEEMSADAEELADIQIMLAEQRGRGWKVSVVEQSCECRTWFKLGCCTHVMAALHSRGLPYDGSPPPRLSFPDKRPRKKRGRPGRIGHALSLQ